MLAQVASNANGVPTIICTLLLIATIIAFILGLAQALGVAIPGNRLGTSRFGVLLVAVILLVVYIVLC